MTVPEIPDFDPGLVVHAAVPDTLKGLYDLERIDRRESYDRLYYELNRIHDLGSADDREESFHVTYPEGSRRSALVYNLKIENEWHHRVIVNDDSRGSDETKRVIDVFTWGLVPVWAKDPSIGARLINARSETVEEKPSFRGSFKNSRCLIIADGFYEWRRVGAGKQPYLIRLKSREPFGFGGLWSHWTGPDGSEISSCAILTTSPNAVMKPIHDRMPVIIPKDRIGEWLDHNRYDPRQLSDFFRPYPDDELETYPVSTLVNSPANDSPACIDPGPDRAERAIP